MKKKRHVSRATRAKISRGVRRAARKPTRKTAKRRQR